MQSLVSMKMLTAWTVNLQITNDRCDHIGWPYLSGALHFFARPRARVHWHFKSNLATVLAKAMTKPRAVAVFASINFEADNNNNKNLNLNNQQRD